MVEEGQSTLIAYRNKLLLANRTKEPSNYRLYRKHRILQSILPATVFIFLGFIGLTLGARWLVKGASALARSLGVPPLMIGLTIVAFGTSAPEMFSSAIAALAGEPELAIGNALGSNLFNVGVALGIAALISPLKPPDSLINLPFKPAYLIVDEIPTLLLVTLVAGALLLNLYVGLFDALILLGLTALLIYQLINKRSDAPSKSKQSDPPSISKLQAIAYLLLGLVFLIGSAELLVRAASFIAVSLGVSTAIIGLTIVALGTSLPELATAVECALKRQHDLVFGTIFGSNILNLLTVLPFPGLFSPGPIEPSLLSRDYLVVLVLTLLLTYYCYRGIKQNKMIGRLCGLIFLSIYCGWFTVMLIQVQI
tara:strand:+ start:1538 stop:2638 length:1101 start_codon:yes stop_codon:yes gene_type:complete